MKNSKKFSMEEFETRHYWTSFHPYFFKHENIETSRQTDEGRRDGEGEGFSQTLRLTQERMYNPQQRNPPPAYSSSSSARSVAPRISEVSI